jgi:HPt (histidine-containing phosphotransfer) domain-containing protein
MKSTGLNALAAAIKRAYPPAECSETPALNKKEALARLGNDEAIFNNIVALFLDQMPVRSRELNDAGERNDYATLAMLAHTLKSSAATVGATALQSLFVTLENASAGKNAETVSRCIAQIGKEFSRYRAAVS